MFRLIKHVLMALLSFSESLTKSSDHAECISLNGQACMTRPTVIELNTDKCNQRSPYYSFTV